MRFGRTLSPAAAPLSFSDIFAGIKGGFRNEITMEMFRAELKEAFRARYCFPVSSGKAALSIILQALHALSPDRDEVLVSALNCFSVPSAISHAGLKLRLCDIDPQSLDYDFKKLPEKLANPKLLCVLSTHLFGRPADVVRLKSLISDSVVTVVEDAAQAFGADNGDQKLGTLGDVGLFSFGRGKALTAVEGGIILTNRADLGEQLETLYAGLSGYNLGQKAWLVLYALTLTCLQRPEFFWLPNSLPFLRLGKSIYNPTFRLQRMSSVQVGFINDWSTKTRRYKYVRKAYVSELSAILTELKQPHFGHCRGMEPDLIRLPWRVRDEAQREKILAESKRKGLGFTRVYPSSLDQIPQLQHVIQTGSCPAAEDLAQTLITLPVHPFMTMRDLAKIKRTLCTMCKPQERQVHHNYKALKVAESPRGLER